MLESGGVEGTFAAELWESVGPTSWYFLNLPNDLSDEIADHHGTDTAFGSVRVHVTIDQTTWRTSVFPSKELATYILPVKKAVRTAENIGDGDSCQVHLRVAVD